MRNGPPERQPFRGTLARINHSCHGTLHELGCRIYETEGEGWWCTVSLSGVSMSGIRNSQDQSEMNEIAVLLLDILRTAPPFRIAGVGVEVESFREFSELDQDLIDLDFNGVVISEAIWRNLGLPSVFVPFSEGFRWKPFTHVY